MPSSAGFDQRTLVQLLDALARFSAPGAGVTRFAYDDAWLEAHRWLVEQAHAADLEATADAAGNLYFHPPSLRADSAHPPRVLLVGSHLDSVKHGGPYDGAYGAIAGLMLAARFADVAIPPAPGGGAPLPVVGFVTAEEEQSRFDGHMLGARAMLGLAGRSDLDGVRDSDGVTWGEALARVRAAGAAAAPAGGERPFAPPFRATIELELHIEQGPVLEAGMKQLGIVDQVAGYRRLRARVTGAARHSGTTPMRLRRDALAAASEMVLAAEALAHSRGEAATATAGNARPEPGLYNVVPGTCEVWLEVRHAEPSALAAMAGALHERCAAIAARRGVALEWEPLTRQEPTPLDRDLVEVAEALARLQGIRHRRMPSGAAHDSMEFARAGVPSLMLFVPSVQGISHAPEEHTEPADLWRGVAFAAELVPRLAVRA